MKRRTLALLLTMILSIGLCACGGSSEPAPAEAPAPVETEEAAEAPEETAEAPEETKPANEADIDGCHIVVTGYNVAKDYNGNPIIVINYDFTNNSGENQTPIWTFFGKAFQDGVELDIAFSMDKNVYDAGIEQKELQPGVTMTGCQKAYAMTSTSPVEFYGGDMLSQDEIALRFDIAQ